MMPYGVRESWGRKNGHYFTSCISEMISLSEDFCILIQISLRVWVDCDGLAQNLGNSGAELVK